MRNVPNPLDKLHKENVRHASAVLTENHTHSNVTNEPAPFSYGA